MKPVYYKVSTPSNLGWAWQVLHALSLTFPCSYSPGIMMWSQWGSMCGRMNLHHHITCTLLLQGQRLCDHSRKHYHLSTLSPKEVPKHSSNRSHAPAPTPQSRQTRRAGIPIMLCRVRPPYKWKLLHDQRLCSCRVDCTSDMVPVVMWCYDQKRSDNITSALYKPVFFSPSSVDLGNMSVNIIYFRISLEEPNESIIIISRKGTNFLT